MTAPARALFVGGLLDGEEIVFQSDVWPDSVSFGGDAYDLRREGDNLAYVYVRGADDEEAPPQTQ